MHAVHGSAGRWMARVAGVMAGLALAACGGGGGSADGGQGTLQVSLTDAPACYRKVLVTIEKVRVQTNASASDTDAGWRDIVPAGGPVQVDLLDLTNGKLADLGAAQVQAGTYSQLRLVLVENTPANPLANSLVLNDGSTVALTTPSAQQSGLKIKSDFSVAAGATTEVLLDFDACKSIVVAGNSGQYILKPVVRLGERVAGSIHGYVTTTMTLSATSVSAQRDGSIVRSTVPDATGKFILSYLPQGTYTVVITADQRATGVVDSVPVGTSTVVLNGTATAVVLPTSAMGTVTGTVTASAPGGGTSTALVTDATVSALQTVGSSLLEIAGANVDAGTAMYALSLPAAAPVRAAWSGTALTSSSFTPSGTGGAYKLRSVSPTKGTKEVGVTVTGGGTATANISY